MNRLKKLLSISFVSTLIFLLTSCNSNDTPIKTRELSKGDTLPALSPLSSLPKEDLTTLLTGNAMTIEYRIIIGKRLAPPEKTAVEKLINRVFQHVDMTYNKWNPYSEISRLNRLKAGIKASISSDLERFFKQIDTIVTLTEGRFDPTIEPLQQLWKKHLEKGTTPTEEEIEFVVPAVGWKNIHYGQSLFCKDHDLTSLDLGGIAKGLCVDMLVETLNKAGYPNVFVEWGGEIHASGQHPEQRPWNIYISHPGNPDPRLAVDFVPLQNEAIATSGDYLQNWTVQTPGLDRSLQKTTYCHIIDPCTYQPLKIEKNTIASTSVLAPNCVLADGLSTAAMLFPTISEAKVWSEKIRENNPELTFWFVARVEKN
jgi:FAD:protein FMN transferase